MQTYYDLKKKAWYAKSQKDSATSYVFCLEKRGL